MSSFLINIFLKNTTVKNTKEKKVVSSKMFKYLILISSIPPGNRNYNWRDALAGA
jgi:hypothetical protein